MASTTAAGDPAPASPAAPAARPGFAERFNEMLHLCGPQSWPSLLATPEQLRDAEELLAAAAGGAPVPPADLLAARRLRNAVCHPDTGEPIPLPFRMAAHVPVNTVLLLGMLGAKTPFATGAWQFLNATFNLAQFYANRNRSNEIPASHVAASYIGAMSSSVAVGAGLRAYFMRAQAAAPGSRAAYLGAAAVPFLAAVAGKPLQIGCMRWDELTAGVTVYDGDGAPRGSSPAAGRSAVAQTILSRVVYLAPMLWLPLLQDGLAAAVPAVARSAPLRAAAAVGLTAASSAYVTPACMAIYEQRATLPVEALEPQFRGLLDAAGRPVTALSFNKGL